MASIARKQQAVKIKVGQTVIAYEYPIIDSSIHGSVIKIKGRYPEVGRVVNDVCSEICYVIEGSGKIFIEGKEIKFKKGDQILVRPGEKYYWNAKTTMYVPCTPAWYPEQHKVVS